MPFVPLLRFADIDEHRLLAGAVADEDAAGTNTGTLTDLQKVRFFDDNTWSAWNHSRRVEPDNVQYDFGWKALREARAPFKEELVMAVFHPDRVGRMLTAHGLDWLERV